MGGINTQLSTSLTDEEKRLASSQFYNRGVYRNVMEVVLPRKLTAVKDKSQ